MSEINTEILISNILNGMMGVLDDSQFNKLKDVLYIQMHDIEVTNKCYDLVASIQENDFMLLEMFVGDLRIAHKSEKTIAQYTRTIMKLRNFIGKNFADISSMDIRYFLAYHQRERKWKDRTVQNTIHYIQPFFNFMVKEEVIIKNPMNKVEHVKVEEVIKKPFSRMELEAIRDACRNDLRVTALVELLLSSGIRVGELVKLKWNDLDYYRLRFMVHGKGAVERETLFNERASYSLQKYFKYRMEKENLTSEELMQKSIFVAARRDRKTKNYEGLEDDGVRHILNCLSAKSGVSDIHPHRFRRTFATELYKNGMVVDQIQKLMGHKQTDTTMIYIKVDLTSIDYAYRKCCL